MESNKILKMKILILCTSFLVISTFSFSQDSLELKKPFYSYLYNIEENILVQNTCDSNLKVKFTNIYLDSIDYRTDSIFKTDKPNYFHIKSYDSNNVLRYITSIHLHVKSKDVFDIGGEEILVSPLYQNCLSIENYAKYDKNGIMIWYAITHCDYGRGFPDFVKFGWDEFGTKTTFKYDEIKRMPFH